nr:hypothetical protein [Pantoea ananatis]
MALGEKEISFDTIITELNQMAEEETCDNRLAEIFAARSWLKQFRQSHARPNVGLRWLMSANRDENAKRNNDAIRFLSDEDDDR